MATHSSILAWRIPRTKEPGGLQTMESQSIGHKFATKEQQLLWKHKCFDTPNTPRGQTLPKPCSLEQRKICRGLCKEMTHSSVLAWRIPGMGEPGGLPSMGSQSRTWLSDLAAAAAAAACKVMSGSCLKKPKLPEGFQQSSFLGKVRERCG